MINILSYVGMNLQAEVCLWTLLGILRTVFDATLFKVNANLKQVMFAIHNFLIAIPIKVWQMTMPIELSMPVQRVLRTMISGIMLVQCFTVYVYLATYIVLLYPVFLEERPTLVLPWLLLAAVRQLLCELLSLALGLGTCLLVGPALPPCIKFVFVKIVSIMPSFYMWMLIFSYYHSLKVAAAFKTFPTTPAHILDCGLELAVRRRRTKSLFNETLLRTRLITDLYTEKQVDTVPKSITLQDNVVNMSPYQVSNAQSEADVQGYSQDIRNRTDGERNRNNFDISAASQTSPHRFMSDIRTSEDWCVNEMTVPRDTDRITEQFGLMMLRIAAYLNNTDCSHSKIFDSSSLSHTMSKSIGNNLNCATLTGDATDTPPLTASSKGNVASYMREYPHIFMKKTPDLQSQLKLDTIRVVQNQGEGICSESTTKVLRQIMSTPSEETQALEIGISQKIMVAEETDLKQKLTYEQLQQLKEANRNGSEIASHNNDKKDTNNGLATSSSDSLSSIITRMKSQLQEALSSRNPTTSHSLSSSRLGPHRNEHSKHHKGNNKDSK